MSFQDCVIQSSSEGIIVCSLPEGGIAGPNAILVTVPGKGFAAANASVVAFVNPLTASVVQPGNVSVEGGGLVKVTGMDTLAEMSLGHLTDTSQRKSD